LAAALVTEGELRGLYQAAGEPNLGRLDSWTRAASPDPSQLFCDQRWPLPCHMSMLMRWWRRTVKRAGQPAWYCWPWRADLRQFDDARLRAPQGTGARVGAVPPWPGYRDSSRANVAMT